MIPLGVSLHRICGKVMMIRRFELICGNDCLPRDYEISWVRTGLAGQGIFLRRVEKDMWSVGWLCS